MNASQVAGEEAPQSGHSVKVVLVGDGGCGKTSLMMVFAKGAFPEVSALILGPALGTPPMCGSAESCLERTQL
jgi:GTPase SAR1 family protein